jgi:hypothetical protein
MSHWKMDEIDNAIKWFRSNDILCYVNDGSVYVNVGGNFDIEISGNEISYRAELWKGELLNN